MAADVKGAFDSVPLPALERVVTALVGSGEYAVSRVAHVQGGAAAGRGLHSSTCQLNLSRVGHNSPCPPV